MFKIFNKEFWRKDKILHLTVSIILTIVIIIISKYILLLSTIASISTGSLITLLIGILKELNDRNNPKKHTEDINDIYADTWGILIGLLIGWFIIYII